MTPYYSYQLYQVSRPKCTAEIRYADVQAGLLAATIADVMHAVARPVQSDPQARARHQPGQRIVHRDPMRLDTSPDKTAARRPSRLSGTNRVGLAPRLPGGCIWPAIRSGPQRRER